MRDPEAALSIAGQSIGVAPIRCRETLEETLLRELARRFEMVFMDRAPVAVDAVEASAVRGNRRSVGADEGSGGALGDSSGFEAVQPAARVRSSHVVSADPEAALGIALAVIAAIAYRLRIEGRKLANLQRVELDRGDAALEPGNEPRLRAPQRDASDPLTERNQCFLRTI